MILARVHLIYSYNPINFKTCSDVGFIFLGWEGDGRRPLAPLRSVLVPRTARWTSCRGYVYFFIGRDTGHRSVSVSQIYGHCRKQVRNILIAAPRYCAINSKSIGEVL